MYTAIILLIIAAAAFLFFRGVQRRKKTLFVWAVALAVVGYLFFWLMDFWGEMLWFENAGFKGRFWTFELTRLGFIIGGFIVGFVVIYLTTFSVRGLHRYYRTLAAAAGGFAAALWGSSNWEPFLRFIYRADAGVADPVFGRDAGFYMFTLPFLDAIITLLLILFVIAVLASLFGVFSFRAEGNKITIDRNAKADETETRHILNSMYLSMGVLAVLLAIEKYLDRFHLLFSHYGVVSGPGWTDVNVRLPAFDVVIVFTLLVALVLFVPFLRSATGKGLGRIHSSMKHSRLAQMGGIFAVTFAVWVLVLSIVPWLFQKLVVEPNELRLEKPYISNNIDLTRKAFALDKVEEREYPVSDVFTREIFENNQNIFNNIRLWDYRALDDVYKQFQEIRLYYEFADVDIDRYHINGKYREVMVSAREMDQRNLPQQSRTFVNEVFKYTHGFGITLTNVSEFTSNGLPNLLIKDIPPVSSYPSLEVKQPRIYYGELTRTHVIVNSPEKEFDYPRGEQNAYYAYQGDGGVQISNIWRKFLFGWKFDGSRLFFSGNATRKSRIMFHRQIRDRVKTIAPFLKLDNDPYITLIDGKLYWIIDAYTTSTLFPYSEPFDASRTPDRGNAGTGKGNDWDLHGKNYIRNSVKAVVDAYSGKVDLYIFDEKDPVISMWNNVLPGMFKDKDRMPQELLQHVRYPADMLLTQGLMYAKYHMTDPTVFYNQEDLWVRATEKYYSRVQPVEPYYVMWELPDTDNQEFILMQPYTPKNRQVAIGWIAGMCDPDNYGRFLSYMFPKEKRVLGPQQVETKIDQDRHLSSQLTLWDQRGSNVIRGNVLAIPVEHTIIYVEPIYLQAETAAYPELRLVAVMQGDQLSYAETFDQAIRGLFESNAPEHAVVQQEAIEQPQAAEGLNALIDRANAAFEDYIRYTGSKEFDKASQALDQLQQTLQQLSNRKQQNE